MSLTDPALPTCHADAGADRSVFGWRMRSDIPLPDLLAWDGDDRAPDITITTGAVPEPDGGWRTFSPAVQFGPHGQVRVAIPRVAAYLIEGGSRVTVAPVLPVTASDIRVFLLGTVLSVLCYRRGLVPLHASAVEVNGRALLLAGASGLGKSTLAAALAGRGRRLLADDICALDTTAPGGPLVRPAFPRLKLWDDAARHLAIATDGLERSRDALLKYHLPIAAAGFRASPAPPAALVVLNRRSLPGPAMVTALRGTAAMRRHEVVHRWRLGQALGHHDLIFHGLAVLARTVPVVELARSDDLSALPALAEQVLALPAAMA